MIYNIVIEHEKIIDTVKLGNLDELNQIYGEGKYFILDLEEIDETID